MIGFQPSRTIVSFLFVCLFSLLNIPPAVAQQANFEMAQRFTEEHMEKLVDDNGIYPRWIEDTNKFWYSYSSPNGEF